MKTDISLCSTGPGIKTNAYVVIVLHCVCVLLLLQVSCSVYSDPVCSAVRPSTCSYHSGQSPFLAIIQGRGHRQGAERSLESLAQTSLVSGFTLIIARSVNASVISCIKLLRNSSAFNYLSTKYFRLPMTI